MKIVFLTIVTYVLLCVTLIGVGAVHIEHAQDELTLTPQTDMEHMNSDLVDVTEFDDDLVVYRDSDEHSDSDSEDQALSLAEERASVAARAGDGPGLPGEECAKDSDCDGFCVYRDSLKRRQQCSAKKSLPGQGCFENDDCASGACAIPRGAVTTFKYCQLQRPVGNSAIFLPTLAVKGADFEACDVDAACTSGRCEFEDNKRSRRRCLPKNGLEAGYSCEKNGDCKGGIGIVLPLISVGTQCKKSPGGGKGYCGTGKGKEGEVCDDDSDCASGQCAPTASKAKRCAPASLLEIGRSCGANDACKSGFCNKQGSQAYCAARLSIKLPTAISALRIQPARLCGSANENSKLSLRCPSGQIIESVVFASYGTPSAPDGRRLSASRILSLKAACPAYRQNAACHAEISQRYVEAQCLKKSACTISVGNGKTAGNQLNGLVRLSDPCPGKQKWMMVQIKCGATPRGLIALSDAAGEDDEAATAAPARSAAAGGCAPPSIPANGVLGDCQNGLDDGQTCSITCNDGFQLQGSAYSCAGTTLNGQQSCVAAGCAVPDKPEIGSYAPAGCPVGPDGKIPSGALCALTCDSGYHIAGAPVPPRKCNNGELQGEQQLCEGDNCVAQTDPIEHGTQGTCGVTVAARATCSIVCEQGYHAEPADPRTCIAGALQGTKQACVGNPCPVPTTPPADGNLGTCSREIKHGESCTVACNPGYKLVGDERTCNAGILSGTAQTCEGLPCSAMTRQLENGNLGTCGAEIAHGGSCTYACDKGYELVGAPLNCKATVISQDNMVCKGLPCAPRQTPPENGGLGDCGAQIPHGATCSFTCKQGYHVVGDPRTCTATVLSGTDQRCEGDACDALKLVPINGQLGDCGKDIAHDSKCQIQCDEGYHVEGDPVSCFAGQLKVQTTPMCIGNPCPAINPLPPHAKPGTCGVEVLHGQSCSIECEFGWLGRGPNERRCFAGKFEGEAQRCIQDPGPDVLDKMDDSISSINKMNENMHEIQIQQQVEEQKHTAIKQHGLEVNAEQARKYVPLWQKAIAGYPKRGFKPIDINNQYTYDRVYMPPETSTDDKVLKAGKSLAASAEALHIARVEAMEAKCKEKTCDVTADTFNKAEQKSA